MLWQSLGRCLWGVQSKGAITTLLSALDQQLIMSLWLLFWGSFLSFETYSDRCTGCTFVSMCWFGVRFQKDAVGTTNSDYVASLWAPFRPKLQAHAVPCVLKLHNDDDGLTLKLFKSYIQYFWRSVSFWRELCEIQITIELAKKMTCYYY